MKNKLRELLDYKTETKFEYKLAAALKVACAVIDEMGEALNFCCYRPNGEFEGSEHPAVKALAAAEKTMGEL